MAWQIVLPKIQVLQKQINYLALGLPGFQVDNMHCKKIQVLQKQISYSALDLPQFQVDNIHFKKILVLQRQINYLELVLPGFRYTIYTVKRFKPIEAVQLFGIRFTRVSFTQYTLLKDSSSMYRSTSVIWYWVCQGYRYTIYTVKRYKSYRSRSVIRHWVYQGSRYTVYTV